MKRWVYAAKLVISAGGVYYVLHTYDLPSILATMLEQDRTLLAVGFMLVIAQIIVASLRWYLVLIALNLVKPFGLVLRIFYGTAFLNTFLPAGVAGDAVRVWLMRDNPGGVVTAVNSVLIDRIVTLLALSLIVVGVQPFVWAKFGSSIMLGPAIGLMAVILVSVLVLVLSIPFIARQSRWRAADRLLSMMVLLSGDLRRVFVDVRALSPILAAAVASNLLIVLAVFVMARGQAINVDLVDCLVAFPVVLLVTAIPISVGGWGTRELAMVYMLGMFAVPAEQATALSINFGLCTTFASLPGALIWLTFRQGAARVRSSAE